MATFGVVGLGYVGLPLLVEVARGGFQGLGIDINDELVSRLNQGESHIDDVPSALLSSYLDTGQISATSDLSRLAECDVVSICVPTPLNKIRDPDLSYVVAASHAVAHALRPGQLIFLESTTYPGTTRETILPLLEETGLLAGEDFFLCFSPERVDPGNPVWHTRNTPKILGGITPACLELGLAAYGKIFDTLVPVSSAESAELTKVYENTFRMINIALANELAQACDRLGVDVWEVIDAAATKPFGFMKFTPGPGLGGHCIPLDPHYLSWKMRTLSYRTRLIELASEINGEMPGFVVRKAQDALNEEGKAVKASRILILGVAYKRDIGDIRESPALEIIQMLQEKGAEVRYHDPFCPVIEDDGMLPISGLPLRSVELTTAELQNSDCVIVVTDHSSVDYAHVLRFAPVTLDTRGVLRKVESQARVISLAGRQASAQKGPSGGEGTGSSYPADRAVAAESAAGNVSTGH
jgi:UDP-N-acetyl-D-glucosamine dehydrogenase